MYDHALFTLYVDALKQSSLYNHRDVAEHFKGTHMLIIDEVSLVSRHNMHKIMKLPELRSTSQGH